MNPPPFSGRLLLQLGSKFLEWFYTGSFDKYFRYTGRKLLLFPLRPSHKLFNYF